ncbi:MAG: ribosomal protein S18-alanine N-acetyltransferase, partial [Anaerolineales bacterium]|nr:ribosomal protein S18-alanine N-acetyltransferase [Anaerolineales bacterium]
EVVVFPTPWPAKAYEYEITNNPASHSLVVEAAGKIRGYGCFWLVVDEIHISNVAIAPCWRGKGLGELLFLAMIHQGIQQNGLMATLEVRESNQVAQSLYKKYGFQAVGRRKRYYVDNREDALIMNAGPLGNAYQEKLSLLQKALWDRLEPDGKSQWRQTGLHHLSPVEIEKGKK